jgi:hypothetical protein
VEPAFADILRMQGHWCGKLGSPLWGRVFADAAADAAAGGPVAAALDGYALEPITSAMALRLVGGAHRLALAGEASGLAAHLPSTGGDGDAERAWVALRALIDARLADIRALLQRPVQTNEVGRAAALIGGFLRVAAATRLPLRCLELGASAGLNLRWDHFRYDAGTGWGDPASPVVLRDRWQVPPPLDLEARVAERAGCDPAPIDPATDDGRLTLLSYVWPDQLDRIAHVRAACDVARRVPAAVERANGADWLETRLATPAHAMATVVYHSIVLQYLDQTSRDRVAAAIAAAGARATTEAPFAWLRMEPGGDEAEVRLTLWPGGDERLVATTGFHGRNVRWVDA